MQLLLVLSILSSFILTVHSIRCYSCESAYDDRCTQYFSEANYFKTDCSKLSPPRYLDDELTNRNSTGCLKINYMESGVRKVRRHCYFGDMNDTEVGCRMDPMLTSMEEYSCFVCDTLYCNHGSPVLSNNQVFQKMLLWTIGCFLFGARLIRLK